MIPSTHIITIKITSNLLSDTECLTFFVLLIIFSFLFLLVFHRFILYRFIFTPSDLFCLYHKLVSLIFLDIWFTAMISMKLTTELNIPTAVE